MTNSTERWFACSDCDVRWHGTDPACWSCEAEGRAEWPGHTRDAMRVEANTEPSGTPLTRFGPRADALLTPKDIAS